MTNALWITLIGMGLVFLAILLLWGLMALLVRLTAEKGAVGAESGPDGKSGEQVVALEAADEDTLAAIEGTPGVSLMPGDALHERRRRAAAAGVAVAMALQRSTRPASPAAARPGKELGAWQSVQRASQLGQRNGFHRKGTA